MAANTGAATEFTAGVPLNDGGFVTAIKAGVELAKPTLMSAAYLIGAPLIVPSAVRFLIGWIPVVGWLVSSLVALAGSLAMIVTMPAFFLVLYSAAAGNAIGWQAAVKSIMGRLVEVVINFFVASLLTIVTIGIMGCYLPGVFFIEGERMFAINFKCLAYFKADWKRIVLSALVASLVVMVPVSIAAYLVGFVFGILPFIGWYLGPNLALLLTTAGIAVMIPIAAATLINLHLQTRAAQGSDVAAELRAMLEQWGVTNAG